MSRTVLYTCYIQPVKPKLGEGNINLALNVYSNSIELALPGERKLLLQDIEITSEWFTIFEAHYINRAVPMEINICGGAKLAWNYVNMRILIEYYQGIVRLNKKLVHEQEDWRNKYVAKLQMKQDQINQYVCRLNDFNTCFIKIEVKPHYIHVRSKKNGLYIAAVGTTNYYSVFENVLITAAGSSSELIANMSKLDTTHVNGVVIELAEYCRSLEKRYLELVDMDFQIEAVDKVARV